ncbi:MAG: hypothetical protein SNJ76_02200 [Fimbriimonadaceae bacterium]
MSVFRFGKPKNPGFGLSRGFYLSVLAAKARLPAILEIVAPKGIDGAVAGFGAPLGQGATKEDLARPLARGAYAVASPDRKTVLRMLVVSKEEAGYDPEALVRAAASLELSEDLLARIRATWTLIQFSFESHDPMVYPALDFLLAVVGRTGVLTEGAVADPVARRYLLPEQLVSPRPAGQNVCAADHIAVHKVAENGTASVHTLGFQKFALPELEITALAPGSVPLAETVLATIAQKVLEGERLGAGTRIGPRNAMLDVAEGGLDRGRWEGIPVFELLPPRGMSIDDALRAWVESA